MSESKFNEFTQSLWIPVIKGDELIFIDKNGNTKSSNPNDSLIYEQDLSDKSSKYDSAIKYMSYNPINPKQHVENGCDKCKSDYLTYIRTGEDQNVIYSCNCNV